MLLHPPADSWPGYHGDYSGRRHSALDPDHAAEREESSLSRGPSRRIRPLRSSPRRCWSMAFCTLRFRTTSGLSMRDPATRSGTTLTRGARASTSGIAAWRCTRDIFSFCLPMRTLFPSTAKDGTVRWNVQVADVTKGYWTSMAPLVVGNHVLVGVSGDFDNLSGYIRSIDPETGDNAVAMGFHSSGRNTQPNDGRNDVDDGNVRSRSQSRLLGNRESDSGPERLDAARAMISTPAASSP